MKISLGKKKEKEKTSTHFDSQNKRSNSAIGSFFGFQSINEISNEGSPLKRRPSLGESTYLKSNTPRTPRKDSPRFFEKLVSPRKITSPRKFSVQGDSSEFNDEISEEEYNEYKLKMKSLQTPGSNFFFLNF
jgi:hypothetical protein